MSSCASRTPKDTRTAQVIHFYVTRLATQDFFLCGFVRHHLSVKVKIAINWKMPKKGFFDCWSLTAAGTASYVVPCAYLQKSSTVVKLRGRSFEGMVEIHSRFLVCLSSWQLRLPMFVRILLVPSPLLSPVVSSARMLKHEVDVKREVETYVCTCWLWNWRLSKVDCFISLSRSQGYWNIDDFFTDDMISI